MSDASNVIQLSCWSAPAVRSDWQNRLKALGADIRLEAEIRFVPVLSSDISWIDDLKRLRDERPSLTTIVLTSPRHQSEVIQGLNQGLVDFVVDKDAPDSLLQKKLRQAADLANRRRHLDDSLLKARDQNRELEQLTQNLEDVVYERTQSAVNSKLELERRVAQLRDILRFMQELGHLASPEDVLTLLRRELKTYHRLQDPVLAFSSSSGDRRLVYFRGGKVHERRVKASWPQSLRIRQGDAQDSQYLANEFGRPVGRIIAIPLVARKSEGGHLHPTLFFEHQFGSNEVEEFLKDIGDRLQVVTVGLDRLLLEYDLRSAAYLWEHTFDGLEDPIAIVDVDYNVLRTNKAFEKKSAVHCYQAFQESEVVCAGCPFGQAMRTAQPQRSHVRRNTDMFAVHAYPIMVDAKDEPTTAVNYYVNVTQDLNLQERMVQTEKMAALGHLAGHIAHELNNPLTGIRGLAQVWLAQKNIPATVHQDLAEIEKAAERSQTIITNLLQFTQAGHGGGTGEKVDLTDLIKRTLPLLKTALSQHSFDLDLPQGPATTLADAQLLQQVIFNLLKNACQAIPQKGEISLRLQPSVAGPSWEVRIKDNGAGIDPEQLPNLFTPFFTTKAKGEGTGLGLSLSRSIVRRFGGDISVSSVVGQGTEFCISFPKVGLS